MYSRTMTLEWKIINFVLSCLPHFEVNLINNKYGHGQDKDLCCDQCFQSQTDHWSKKLPIHNLMVGLS